MAEEKIVKVEVRAGEWWPVYYINEHDEDDTELRQPNSIIPESKLLEYQRINKEFDEMQEYLQKLYYDE